MSLKNSSLVVTTINPATEEIVGKFQTLTLRELETVVAQAATAFEDWRRSSVLTRADLLRSLAKELRKSEGRLALMITVEMGKVIGESRAEVKKSADALEWIANHYQEYLKPILMPSMPMMPPMKEQQRAEVLPTPLGVILGIMPWNFPLWQVIRFAAPTLLGGNTVLLKHAPNTWGCAELIEECFSLAGFPRGVYQNLKLDVPQTEALIQDQRVRGVSLTGSTEAGRRVAELAGRSLKKVVLELGGSDPYIVLADADMELAAQTCVAARMLNAGQSCIAAKRWIVSQSVEEEFLKRVLDLLKDYSPGDPQHEGTRLGPLARIDLRQKIHDQVLRSKDLGAELLLGGSVPEGKGFFYPATLLRGSGVESPLAFEELFGPVASLWVAPDDESCIELANRSRYGLGAALFSRDGERARALAGEGIEAGMVFINQAVRSDVRWPFGGIKDSGLGRELSQFGLWEFQNLKTVVS